MPFRTASISSPGGRTGNEDCAGYLEAGDAGCWIVADGLGFHGGGATASRVAVETVLTSFRANPAVSVEALREHLHRAHAAIRGGQTTPELAQMKSTAVVLLANQTAAVCGHVGDSRLYHFQASHIAYQTQDHSVPGALAASGDIGSQQIRFHEDRNRLLRSLGGDNENGPTIETRNLCQRDSFLLCSDGFWEYVNELEMEVDCAKSSTPAEWMSFMTARLLQRAQAENDNYTGIGVFFQSPSAPPPSLPPPRTKAKPVHKRADQITIAAIILLAFSLLVFVGVTIWAKSHAVRGIVERHLPVAGGPSSPKDNPRTEPSPAITPPAVAPQEPSELDPQVEIEIRNARPGGRIRIKAGLYTVHASHIPAPIALSVKGDGAKITCLVVEGDFARVFAAESTFSKLTVISESALDTHMMGDDAAQFRPDQAPMRCVAKSVSGGNP